MMILDEALAMAFGCLADRRGAFRTPTLATRALDGGPSLRTVVLRGFDAASRVLSIHTDRRSAKAAEIAADGRAVLHGYDAVAQLQLRLAGKAVLHVEGAIVAAAWAASHAGSRVIYAGAEVPGTPVAAPPAAPLDAAAGRAHFAVVTLRVDALDWLLLAPEGHRRARFAWDGDGVVSGGWVAP